ncbi:hypothetical protein HID58_090856 [Brassica napus]|uniref:F-box/kelch-repeat protein n=1 Tax=Brassica napus TaxID=3708 RepID=A0ABQ7XB51_BRANA|nr:hypothetical protein HID58_090856 [Brassica napus]
MLSNGDTRWTMFDKDFENFQKVPELPSDMYEVETSKWFKGPAMITPRILFASATCGTVVFVAGGLDASLEVVSKAEKYDSETKTWTRLNAMHKRRKFCSGWNDTWELIPDILKDMSFSSVQSPPPSAVRLGDVPVRAKSNGGWGVAFKVARGQVACDWSIGGTVQDRDDVGLHM